MMPYQRHPYFGEHDKQFLYDLALHLTNRTLHAIDLPYRLSSWALDDPQNVGLWFDEEERLVAWAVLQTPFWSMDLVCHHSAEAHLLPEILAWADQRAQEITNTRFGHPAWYVMVIEDQTNLIHVLETAGFKCQAEVGENSWSQVLMRRETLEPVRVYQPPAGYRVRPLAGEKEVEAYVELHRSVFNSKNMSVEWRTRVIQNPAYRNDLDIVVESPQGQLVAFCICWFDEQTATGQVEPLGCHQDYRKYALGRVALSEGLHRLQAKGAKKILVETDSYRNTAFRLYEFFDFQVVKNILVYRKDYPT